MKLSAAAAVLVAGVGIYFLTSKPKEATPPAQPPVTKQERPATIDAKGFDSWFGAVFVLLTGIVMFEVTRRQFVRLHRAHPKILYPVRRLLRRDPEFVAMFYGQYLRVERLLLPRRIRFAMRLRHKIRGRRAA